MPTLKLKFMKLEDPVVSAVPEDDEDNWEWELSKEVNCRLVEQARRAYLEGLQKLQAEIALQFNPQLVEEKDDDEPLDLDVVSKIQQEVTEGMDKTLENLVQ